MDKHEITTLRLIESLERDPRQTQRDLSKDLNISLGLVNSFTKRLIQKGFFKLITIPKNRVKYMLTPEGMYEKTRLTYQYLRYSLEFYKETRSKIRSIYEQIVKQGKKRVFLIGAGGLAEIATITLQESELEMAGVIDNEREGDKLLGITIKGLSSLANISSYDTIIITKRDSKTDVYDRIRAQDPEIDIIDLCK